MWAPGAPATPSHVLPGNTIPEADKPSAPGAQDSGIAVNLLFTALNQLSAIGAVDFLDTKSHDTILSCIGKCTSLASLSQPCSSDGIGLPVLSKSALAFSILAVVAPALSLSRGYR